MAIYKRIRLRMRLYFFGCDIVCILQSKGNCVTFNFCNIWRSVSQVRHSFITEIVYQRSLVSRSSNYVIPCVPYNKDCFATFDFCNI